MKLATVKDGDQSRAARLEDERYELLPFDSVGQLLRSGEDLSELDLSTAELVAAADVTLLPVVPDPGKILCVGLNYAHHIEEMGRPRPEYPTVFAKFADTLTGPDDDIVIPASAQAALDWEAELVIVIGETIRNVTGAAAASAIAGYTVMNDISMRDWQNRTNEWLQGKCWERTTPLGPVMVTADELEDLNLEISCEVDGDERQAANTNDLVFDPVTLVEYLSTIVTLRPGDLIATGTPGGVGHGMDPKTYLQDGQLITTTVERIGTLRNRIVFA